MHSKYYIKSFVLTVHRSQNISRHISAALQRNRSEGIIFYLIGSSLGRIIAEPMSEAVGHIIVSSLVLALALTDHRPVGSAKAEEEY